MKLRCDKEVKREMKVKYPWDGGCSDWARVGVGETGEPRNAPRLQPKQF